MKYKEEADNEKEADTMNVTISDQRPCTISESIIQSCKEVKKMREEQIPKKNLTKLFSDINDWAKEEE